VIKVIPFVAAIFLLLFTGSWASKDGLIRKGANADPNPNSFRSRFPVHLKKAQESTQKSGGVKILESLSRSASTFNNNPSSHGPAGAPVEKKPLEKSILQKRLMDYDDFSESESDEGEVPSEGSYNPFPVLASTPKPVPPPLSSGKPGYYNKPQPAVVSYKPGGSPGPGLVFPPVTNTVDPPIVGPMSTFAPVGPPGPSATSVPIIGGPDSGGSGNELPPSPPEDIFPPSPPEIESVGRSLPLRSGSPRTRISNVGATPTLSSREASSFRRSGAPGAPGGSGGNTANKRIRLRDKVRASLESVNEEDSGADLSSDPNVITGKFFSTCTTIF